MLSIDDKLVFFLGRVNFALPWSPLSFETLGLIGLMGELDERSVIACFVSMFPLSLPSMVRRKSCARCDRWQTFRQQEENIVWCFILQLMNSLLSAIQSMNTAAMAFVVMMWV